MERDKIEEELKKELMKTENMEKLLTKLFGKDGWNYDKGEDVWLVPWNKTKMGTPYFGPDHVFCVFRRGGSWFKVIVSDEFLSHKGM